MSKGPLQDITVEFTLHSFTSHNWGWSGGNHTISSFIQFENDYKNEVNGRYAYLFLIHT